MGIGEFNGELIGTIDARKTGGGSKSQKTSYVIVSEKLVRIGDETFAEITVELKGENPFEQPTLKKLVGKRVRAAGGHWIDNPPLWRAESIEEIVPSRSKPVRKPAK